MDKVDDKQGNKYEITRQDIYKSGKMESAKWNTFSNAICKKEMSGKMCLILGGFLWMNPYYCTEAEIVLNNERNW